MRETIRDFTLAVAAGAALFAAFQSWTTARDLAGVEVRLREDLAELRGQLKATSDAVLAHVNAPGLHGRPD